MGRRPWTALTPSRLREDVYRILDRVLDTGVPVEVERRGRRVRIVPVEPRSKLAPLRARRYLRTVPEALVHIDWSGAWRP